MEQKIKARVRTESGSVYYVDEQQGILLRESGAGASQLRKDGHQITLITVQRLVVGEPAVFVVQGLAEGAVTVRYTTSVTEIENL